jgi:serine/threonine protein kinase
MVWTIGTTLDGKYQVEAELSRLGGFGMTYRAQHVKLKEPVVIKSPHAHRQNEPNYGDFVACFEKEGQNLAKLAKKQHPNIVKVRDFFYEGPVPCLVMDYVEGQTLEAIVLQAKADNQTLPEETIVPWIVTIAQALDRVHELGLIHRDANPANIIINQNQEPILIDFGIALNIQPRATTTIAGFAGHRDFAPLEQLEPEEDNPDCATARNPQLDIYCLAATLYFGITGECPKSSYSRNISINRKNKDSLIPPQTIAPHLSDRIHHAILAGMEMDPDDRPATMKDWITLLTTDAGITPKTPPTLESLPIETLEFTTIEVNEKAEIMAEPTRSVQAFDEPLNDDLTLKMIVIPGGFAGWRIGFLQ